MEAAVLVYVDRVLDVIAVEGNGVLADGRREGVLQQSDLVVVDVDVGEHLFHHRVQDVARLDQFADACRILSLDDGLLVVRTAAVDVLGDRLVDGQWQDELVVVGAHLNLVEQPLLLLDLRVVDEVGRNLIGGKRQFLIAVILIEIAQREVGALLGGNHLAHQLYRRVVLSAVAVAPRLDRHFPQLAGVVLQLDVKTSRGAPVDGDSQRLVANGTEGQRPALVAPDAILALEVGSHGYPVALIDDAGVGDAFTGLFVGDDTRNLLCPHGEHSK